MLSFVSMASIRKDFDEAMKKQGYVRVKVKLEEWGISADKFQKLLKAGYECDWFIVNGVRYIHIDTPKPEV